MRAIRFIFRSFFKKGQNNIIKIISLGTGLAVALVLLSKVSFDNNFDGFYPDADNIYQITSFYKMGEESAEEQPYSKTPGGVAPGFKTEIPEIKQATRFTRIAGDATFSTIDKNKYIANFILADSCFFDLFPRKLIIGDNPKEVLSRPMTAMIAKSIADRMGGYVIGKEIEIENYPDRKITIGGVFEDTPMNSHLHKSTQVIISLSSIRSFIGDGRDNWLGNDRYISYVKMHKGIDPNTLGGAVRRVQEKYQDIKNVEARGTYIRYSFTPLTKIYSDSPDVKRMILILSIIAFSLIVTSVLNYLLMVFNSLAGRGKEMAVYKCYGASSGNITKQIFTETLVFFILSLLLAILLIFCFRNVVGEILATPIIALINLRSAIFLLIICCIIFLITALIPSCILSNIPVASVFQYFGKSRKKWKLALLLTQIIGASFLFSLLVIISMQYNMMINDDPGYSYKNIVYTELKGIPLNTRSVVVEKLEKLSGVDMVSTSSSLPLENHSGNNIQLVGSDEQLFNIADFYGVNANYTDIFDLKMIKGKSFDQTNIAEKDILISKSFEEQLKLHSKWEDVINKEIIITEHGLSRIIGIYEDFLLGSLINEDKRPSVMFYNNKTQYYIIVRLKELNADNIRQVNTVLKDVIPERDIYASIYTDEMVKGYDSVKMFNKSILIGGIVTILITLMGLIGYLNSEMVRRTSEIAVRKINGATLNDILKLFATDILKTAIAGIILGSCISFYVADKWMENFSLKVSLSPILFIICGIVVLLFIELVVLINCYRIANQNPVESLKTE